MLDTTCVFDITPVQTLLNLSSPSQISLVLNSLGLAEFAHYEAFLRGVEGQVLLKADQDLCQFNPSYRFQRNEIVAWKDPEKSVFRYGRIIEEHRDQWNLLAKVNVCVGPDKEMTILSSDVWHFEPKSTSSQEVKEEVENKLSSSGEELTGTVESKDIPVVETLQVGAKLDVSSSDAASLVHGVQSMLKRVGLPLSLDTQELMGQNLQLKTELAQMQESKHKLEAELKNSKEEVSQAFQCQICQVSSVNHVLDQCGHTVCGDCLPNLRNRCPYCRTPFRKAVKFYKPAS
jgi:rubrerythrin